MRDVTRDARAHARERRAVREHKGVVVIAADEILDLSEIRVAQQTLIRRRDDPVVGAGGGVGTWAPSLRLREDDMSTVSRTQTKPPNSRWLKVPSTSGRDLAGHR